VTERQRKIAVRVQAHKSALLAEAVALPVGHEVSMRLPPPDRADWRLWLYALRVRLIRLPDSVRYREDVQQSKGRAVPRWRTLATLPDAAALKSPLMRS